VTNSQAHDQDLCLAFGQRSELVDDVRMDHRRNESAWEELYGKPVDKWAEDFTP